MRIVSPLWIVLLVDACFGDSYKPEGGAATECRVDADCPGAHDVCDYQTDALACVCAAGYTRDTDGACAWSGVVKAPGFDPASSDDDFAAWIADDLVVLDRNLDNVEWMLDPGAAVWENGDPPCKRAPVTQLVRMPRYSRSGPLVAVVNYAVPGAFRVPITLSVAFGTTSFDLWLNSSVGAQDDGVPTQQRFCLGAGAYAPESSTGVGVVMPLTLRPSEAAIRCSGGAMFVDRVEVLPAMPDECPAPGEVVNGDAEGTGGWTFENFDGFGMLSEGVGENGSRGARMVLQGDCSGTSVLEPLSMPTKPSAISLFVRASPTASVQLLLGTQYFFTIEGTGTGETHRVCVPAQYRGIVANLLASLRPLHGSEDCAGPEPVESVIDSMKLVDDPSCAIADAASAPGF